MFIYVFYILFILHAATNATGMVVLALMGNSLQPLKLSRNLSVLPLPSRYYLTNFFLCLTSVVFLHSFTFLWQLAALKLNHNRQRASCVTTVGECGAARVPRLSFSSLVNAFFIYLFLLNFFVCYILYRDRVLAFFIFA